MNRNENQKLNEKLLKFAGFHKKPLINNIPKNKYDPDLLHYPDGLICVNQPDLVDSLNDQRYYLYPNLQILGYEIEMQIKPQPEKSYVFIKKNRIGQKVQGANLAQDFALSCEKIIDRLEKNKNG
ncbi:MAG: hypothetical protein WC389_13960 [Lutibacter sp.]|jgi:hypothetical protein